MLLREYAEYGKMALAEHVMGRWELLHEEVGFAGPQELYDRDLIDLDGQETHLSHAMERHEVKLS